jgi:hypothetical protein
MARRNAPLIPDEVLDQLLSGTAASAAFDQGRLLDQLKKALTERALNAEMDHLLAGDGGAGNSRNGYGRKSVVTDTGRWRWSGSRRASPGGGERSGKDQLEQRSNLGTNLLSAPGERHLVLARWHRLHANPGPSLSRWPLRPRSGRQRAATCRPRPRQSVGSEGLRTGLSPCKLASAPSRHAESDFKAGGNPQRL